MLEFNKIKVGILNLGLNNLYSIYSAFKNIGYKTTIINHKNNFLKFDILVIPGIGAFKRVMHDIKKKSIDKKILEYVGQKKLLFGICLGMQILFEESEEFGKYKGLGILKGEVKKFNSKISQIPHMSWNKVFFNDKKIKSKFKSENFFYFVHSYYCVPKNKKIIFSETLNYKSKFASSVKFENIIATQFHPEKSGIIGIKFLKNLKNYI